MSSETESVTDGYIDFFLLSLVEWAQKQKIDLNIETIESNARRSKFVCTISIGEDIMAQGIGASKKEAEQNSAEKVIQKLQVEAQGEIEI